MCKKYLYKKVYKLETTTQSQNQVKSGLLLNIVVRQSTVIL